MAKRGLRITVLHVQRKRSRSLMRKAREERAEGGILKQQILQRDPNLVINSAFLSGAFRRERCS